MKDRTGSSQARMKAAVAPQSSMEWSRAAKHSASSLGPISRTSWSACAPLPRAASPSYSRIGGLPHQWLRCPRASHSNDAVANSDNPMRPGMGSADGYGRLQSRDQQSSPRCRRAVREPGGGPRRQRREPRHDGRDTSRSGTRGEKCRCDGKTRLASARCSPAPGQAATTRGFGLSSTDGHDFLREKCREEIIGRRSNGFQMSLAERLLKRDFARGGTLALRHNLRTRGLSSGAQPGNPQS